MFDGKMNLRAPINLSWDSIFVKVAIGILASVMVFSISMKAKVRDTYGDAYLTLLVSQSIVQNHSLKLDRYFDEPPFDKNHHAWHEKNGHIYQYFPLGTSLFAVPFVFVANLLGSDMLTDERSLQVLLAAVASTLVFMLLYRTALFRLAPYYAVLLAIIFFLGTSLATMATALWSMDFEIVFIMLTVYLIVRQESTGRIANPYLLGTILFSAYVSKPTASLFIAVALAWCFLSTRKKSFFLKTAFTTVILLSLFIGFSLIEYGQALPDYYLPSRLGGGTFWTALYGNLISPSRGILVFSPFFLLSLAGAVAYFRKIEKKQRLLFTLALFWFLFHVIMISLFPHWWAGWSFGPRAFSDGVPALFLISVLLMKSLLAEPGKKKRAVFLALYIIFGIAAMFINTKQGLFNKYILTWSAVPNVDENPAYIFDWRYPQFLASKDMIKRRLITQKVQNANEIVRSVNAYRPGIPLTPENRNAIFINNTNIKGQITSTCQNPYCGVLFTLDHRYATLQLKIKARSEKRVRVVFNGLSIISTSFSGLEQRIFPLDQGFSMTGVNFIEFVANEGGQFVLDELSISAY